MNRRKLRVLVLVDRLFPAGGAERLAVEVALRLDPDRFERTVCASRPMPRPGFVDELRAADMSVLELGRRSRLDVAAWRPLVSLLRRERIDVLHAHKFGSNVWGTVLGRLARVPVVVAHEHTWSYEGQPVRRLLDRELIARWADAFVAVSREDRRRMTEVEGIDPARTRFLPNGIPPLPAFSGHDVRNELGLGPDDLVAVSVSVLRPQKALDVLVRAAALLAPRFPRLRVLIVGRGSEEERLRALVETLGVGSTVILTGERRDVPDVLAAADVAVSSSDFEGSPLAVMEYMAAGKPVVATRVGGVPDLVRDGEEGLLVPRGDPEALARGLAGLLSDATLRASMGQRARARQRAEFDVDVTVRRIEELYEELFARTERARRERWAAAA